MSSPSQEEIYESYLQVKMLGLKNLKLKDLPDGDKILQISGTGVGTIHTVDNSTPQGQRDPFAKNVVYGYGGRGTLPLYNGIYCYLPLSYLDEEYVFKALLSGTYEDLAMHLGSLHASILRKVSEVSDQ